MMPKLIYPPLANRKKNICPDEYFSFNAVVWTLYAPIKPAGLSDSQVSRQSLIELNHYLPGLLVSLYSIRRHHEIYKDIKYAVMVTPDIPDEALQIISKFTDHIWQVPYITRPVHVAADSKLGQRENLDTWINASYTKYNAMTLPYKKVILLDCDTLCLGQLIPLFSLKTPAACYANIEHMPFGNIPNYHVTLGSSRLFPEHGEHIAMETLNKSLTQNGTVFNGAVLVLSPNISEFQNLLKLLDRVKFSSESCLSKPDEQCLATFYMQQNILITNISAIYNASQQIHAYLHGSRAVMLHFPGFIKPWMSAITDSSIKTWHTAAAICAVMSGFTAIKEYTMCKNLNIQAQHTMHQSKRAKIKDQQSDQSVSQLSSQPLDQSVSQLSSQPLDQPLDQSSDQSSDEIFKKWFDELFN